MQIALMRHVEKTKLVRIAVKDHNGRNLKSHILGYSVESGHANVSCEDFKTIANSWKRKISESMLIKENRPKLNIHDKSLPLKLFN